MSLIILEKMQFYAHHGCFDEEQTVGANYEITLAVDVETDQAALSDNLTDTLNYQTLYLLVKEQMKVRSRLLEHVSQRIIDSLTVHFPQIEWLELHLSKINPPLGGQVERATVVRQWSQSQPKPQAANL